MHNLLRIKKRFSYGSSSMETNSLYEEICGKYPLLRQWPLRVWAYGNLLFQMGERRANGKLGNGLLV